MQLKHSTLYLGKSPSCINYNTQMNQHVVSLSRFVTDSMYLFATVNMQQVSFCSQFFGARTAVLVQCCMSMNRIIRMF